MTARVDKKRRIAFVSDAVYPFSKGGKEVRLYEMTQRLAKAGFAVDVYTMKWWKGSKKTYRQSGVTLHAISPLYPLYAGERRSITQGVLFGLAGLKMITKRFDIVDVDHMPYFPLFSVWLVASLRRKPMVGTWHEVWGRDYWQHYLNHGGRLAAFLEWLTARTPSRIVTISDLTKGRLERDLRTKADVIMVPCGIDASKFSNLRPASRTSDVIFTGRVIEHKNVDALIRAVAELKKTRPTISCFIIGNGPERERLETLADQLDLSTNVTFLGFVKDHADVYRLMRASKVFVSPSTREGFGISVLEANACGLPVIVTGHPDNASQELVTPETGAISKLSPKILARAIDHQLNQKTNRRAIVRHAKSYDWQQAADALAKVYAV
jgi:glycosyltransferase involved in cell wall biosynthesis